VKQFDTTGMLTHQLKTPFMHHIPYENKHWFKTPVIRIKEPKQPVWDINAQEAIAFDGGEHIRFQHHVSLHHHAHEKQAAGTIQTEEMTYYPKQKRASTLAEIIWQQAGNRVESIGMNAFLAEHRIDLLRNTRVTYAPIQG
jgi:lipopolysaccharide export system protein LptC